MSKILSLIIILMMAVHLIKPLGLPGLKRRKDFWKLALIAIAAIVMTVAVRPGDERGSHQRRVADQSPDGMSQRFPAFHCPVAPSGVIRPDRFPA